MAFRFHHHYTRDEARALLPRVRVWLREVKEHRDRLTDLQTRLTPLLQSHHDLGGPEVNAWIKSLLRVQRVMKQFAQREIQIKDLDRGLIDFPAFLAGKEVFLCWEEEEADIEFWHDLDSGYAGREPI